ncbi:MAG: hypothetical protein LIO62_02375 [Clostridiales bacterium]|nr:hypothetical protein [Clostridiales bacterium]
MICFAFSACSSNSETDDSETESESTNVAVETEEAKIKEEDAINFIESSYTEEELGLDDVEEDYSFMVASSGVTIEDENYIKVVAGAMTKNDTTDDDGNDTFSMQTYGEYYISFDGDTVLMKNMDTDEYSELENRYADYSAKSETVADVTETTTAE